MRTTMGSERSGFGRVGLCLCLAVAVGAPALWAAENGEVGKIAAVQNEVETRPATTQAWSASEMNQPLYDRDRVRTGAESRAAILYSDQTLHRINEKSEVEVLPPKAGNPGLLRVLSGKHYFSSRKPKDYGRIETPTVTAAIRGTEFVVDVADGGVTTITMLEGVVEASNSFGTIEIGRGEQAYVEPGKAPIKRVAVRPRDAVSWSLYYPRVLGGSDAARLREMGPEGRDLVRAAELMSAGQVDEARPLIDGAREAQPRNPVALALASVIEVVGDDKDAAMDLAERAVDAGPDSVSAALALSFASQARFDVERARVMAEKAAELDPESAEALARVAELRMAEGDTRSAKRAAERAVRRDPENARALAVLGFVQLAEFHSAEALATFDQAVRADPSFALARLGLGIARIRRGDLGAGREEIQTAVILDPENSLLRSYLAKAYYEEKRDAEAGKELVAAKELDPLDPTPWLYDAIIKQNDNRPVEALADLRESIVRNDNRAVYRSQMLLDQDQAVRGADLARIYNDLGFEQLGLVTARQSSDLDQSNYSAHLALAGNYRRLPGFAPAFLSEVLQARIYQPVSVNAVRPDVVNESVSFNEYTALFERPRVRAFGGVEYEDTDTDLGDLVDPDQVCLLPDGTTGLCKDLLELNDSSANGGEIMATMNRDRFAGALSFSTFEQDGFRINNDIENDVVRGFLSFAASPRDHFQVNLIDGSRTTGDLPLREIPALVVFERLETDLTNVGLGYHRMISPAADLAISAIYSETEQSGMNEFFGSSSTAKLDGPQIEAQYVLRKAGTTWVMGAGHFSGDQELVSTDAFGTTTSLTGDDTFSNAYVYAKLRNLGPVELTAGAAWEDVEAPIGLLPPRDSAIGVSELQYTESKLAPKLGVTWYATAKTAVRGSAYYRLAPAIGRLQTLEPTQVAGFNQFFDEPGGTWSLSYGLGVDQEFHRRVFGGFSLVRRDLEIQEPYCENPGQFSGCAFQQATIIAERESDDWLANVYVNGTVGKRVALSLEYAYEERDFDFTQVTPAGGLFQDFVRTERLRPEVRAFFPFGLFFGVRATGYDQRIDQFDDLASSSRTRIESDFWVGDIELGYRFPKRWGSVVLEARNINDEEFVIYRSALEEDVIPARRILMRVNFTY